MKPQKILWHSNSGHCNTGYGVQTSLFVPRIKALGYDIAVSSVYGLEGAPMVQDGIRQYPADGNFGNRTLASWASHHAGEGHDLRDCLVITLIDVWVLKMDALRLLNLASWVPVDSHPVPEGVLDYFKRTGARPIAMSKFGEDELAKAGLDPLYVPHGVDTKVYRPLSKADRAAMREAIDVPESGFLVGMVANNQGNAPPRKAFSETIAAFAKFRKSHPDAFLYLHTELTGHKDGVNIPRLLEHHGVPAHAVRYASQFLLEYGIPAEGMAHIYNALDVLVNASMGEGFGVPIIEAQACFPASTPIEAEDVMATFTKPYTGDLIKIETSRGSLEATEDHPVWTARGWQSAGCVQPGDQLLYCHAPEGTEQTHAGEIGTVVESLQGDAPGPCGGGLRDDVRFGLLAAPKQRLASETVFGLADTAFDLSDRGANLVLRRACGWRGDGHDPQSESREGQEQLLPPLHHHREHGQETDGLAHGDISATAPNRLAEDATEIDRLSVLARGAWLPPVLSGASAEAGVERRSLGVGNRVDGTPTLAIQDGPLDSEAVGDHLADPRSQYETVTAVSRRHVEDEPVYNLATASGTYRVGDGYLVHNCGVPVIVGDWTAMPELCGAGWTVEGQPFYIEGGRIGVPQRAFQYVPFIDSIADKLSLAYANAEGLRERAVEFAAAYDADLVTEKFWKPALEVLGAQRESEKVLPAVTLNRKMRRAAKKAA